MALPVCGVRGGGMIAIQTTVLLAGLTCVLCAGALALQREAGGLNASRWAWIGGFVTLGLGWTLCGLIGPPNAAGSPGLANMVTVGGVAAFVPGFDVVANRTPRWWVVPAAVVTAVAVVAATGLLETSSQRAYEPLLAAMSIGLWGLVIGRVTRGVPARYRPAAGVAGGFAMLVMGVEAVRIWAWGAWVDTADPASAVPMWVTAWTGYLIASMGFGFVCLRLLTLGESAVLDKRARQDSLTAVASRAALMDELKRVLDRGQRYGRPCSLIAVDMDDLKGVNDRYGHAAGDACLRQLADVVRTTVREPDLVGRLGGDEFVVVCAETRRAGAYRLAERIRALMDGASFCSTLSFGVAEYTRGDTPTSLLKRADDALYAAKAAGGNRTRSCE